MKKFIYVFAFFGMLCLNSCSSDNDGYVDVPRSYAEQTNKCNTIVLLEQYNNEHLGETMQTRSFFGFLGRLFKTVTADVVGAGEALLENASKLGNLYQISPTVGNIGTVAVAIGGAIPASVNAWKNSDCSIVATYPSRDQMLYNLRNYLSHDVILADGPSHNPSTVLHSDTVFALIDFPSDMEIMKSTGVYHNKVIIDSECSLIIPFPIEGSSSTNDYVGNNPGEVVSELDNLISSNNYQLQFNSTWNAVADYMEDDTFDYSSYLNAVYPGSNNVKSTYILFLQALNNQTAVTTMSDVINLINDYVDIIETSNDFSQDERRKIYAGMSVAAYSFNLWHDKFAQVELDD